MNNTDSIKLRAVPQSLRAIARDAVADFRATHAPDGLNAEAYRRLGALQQLEHLMEVFGTEWVELRAQELATARRVRGLK